MRYKLDALAGFSDATPSLLVPIFRIGNQNVPYVQIMDRYYKIISLVPYYYFESATFFHSTNDISVETGSKGIIGILIDARTTFCGDIDQVRSWISDNEEIINRSPLLRVQLLRMSNASVGEKYNAVVESASGIFVKEASRDLWPQSELVLLQKNSQIWDAIEQKQKEPKVWQNPVAAETSIDVERLINWLSSANNFDNPFWAKCWFLVEGLFQAVDERLATIGVRWLTHLFGSGGELFLRGSSVMNRILQFGRGRKQDRDLTELLLDLFEGGQIFDRELKITSSNIEEAYMQVHSVLERDDRINLLYRLLMINRLYESELQFFIERLYYDVINLYDTFQKEEAENFVRLFDGAFFGADNLCRFADNPIVARWTRYILDIREELADYLEIKTLQKWTAAYGRRRSSKLRKSPRERVIREEQEDDQSDGRNQLKS